MRIGLVVAGLLMSSAAMAQGNAAATRKAQEEARHYVPLPCLMEEADKNAFCEAGRARFLRDYQAAKAGDYQGQVNVSAWLSEKGRVDTRPFLEPNRLQSCAWALVVVLSAHARAADKDVAYVRMRCDAPGVDRRAAELRAAAIIEEIRRSPAQMPMEPRVQRQPGPMVTTVPPLGSD
jgi:hypothetical protein